MSPPGDGGRPADEGSPDWRVRSQQLAPTERLDANWSVRLGVVPRRSPPDRLHQREHRA